MLLEAVKKRSVRSPVSAATSLTTRIPVATFISSVSNPPPSSKPFRLVDSHTGNHFLIDTGAFLSVFPASDVDRRECRQDSSIQLVAANGTPIASYGRRRIQLFISGRSYEWDFVLADVTQPLIGSDFLAHFGLLVDVAGQRLLDSDNYASQPLLPQDGTPTQVNAAFAHVGPYANLFDEYSDVFRAELRQKPGSNPMHGIFHHIETIGPPVFSKFRRLSPQKLEVAKAAFDEMLAMGVCSRASSPYASPLHMVPKSDGSWRPCGDYRRLNQQTVPDHYPMPNITDLTSSLNGAKIFSKLDLLKGYFQVPVYPEDVPKTCIITPFGSFVFHYSTFGLKNSGATFQRMMDSIFGSISYCIVYVDDLLVFSRNESEHFQHLRTILSLLRDNGLVVRSDKCQFGVPTVSFLGHTISSSGIAPLESKVEAIKKFPVPSTVHELQRYLGLLNYYHRFIPHAANVLAPLYDAVSGKAKHLMWDSQLQEAFDRSKNLLADSTLLAYPVPKRPLELLTDASDVAVGAALQQVQSDGSHKPLAFFSKKLRPPEKRYSVFDRELLSAYLATRHFRYLLEGAEFTIKTDHRPLISALTKSSDALSARQQRQLSAISELGCLMEYVPGKSNPVADALSRIEIDSIQPGIDYRRMASLQASDPETAAYRSAITSLVWRDFSLPDSAETLLCDISTGKPRPLVPAAMRREVFEMIHSLSHPSIRATVDLVAKRFVWHGLRADVRTWARACLNCQKSKVIRHTESGISSFPDQGRRFAHLHVDIVGPLPLSDGFRYLFTMTERTTRWPDAVPMVDASTYSCAKALLEAWISRFGVPTHLTSDRGSVFTSKLWKNLSELLGIQLHVTTAYNPEANGMAERTHRTLKQSIMARCNDSRWSNHLPWILLGLRTTPKEGIGVSPAEMVYGEPISVPGEFFDHSDNNETIQFSLAQLRRVVGKFAPFRSTKANYRKTNIPNDLQKTQYVFIREDSHRPPLTRPYRGPYRVVGRSNKAMRLLIGNKMDWVSIDRLKCAYIDHEISPDIQYTRSGRLISSPDRFCP